MHKPAPTSPCEKPVSAFSDEMTASLPALRRFAQSLCRQRDMADDLVQDTMVRAWSSRHTFQPGSKFRPWVFTILRNQFYSSTRKRSRLTPWDPEAAERILIQQPDQEEGLHLEDIEVALGQLPNPQREMLMLIAGAGMSYEEAAIETDCKIGTVKSRINRGRAAIREIIDGANALPEA